MPNADDGFAAADDDDNDVVDRVPETTFSVFLSLSVSLFGRFYITIHTERQAHALLLLPWFVCLCRVSEEAQGGVLGWCTHAERNDKCVISSARRGMNVHVGVFAWCWLD